MASDTEKLLSTLDALSLTPFAKAHAKEIENIGYCVRDWHAVKEALVFFTERGWSFNGMSISEPVLEKVADDRFRFVTEVSYGAMLDLRKRFQLPVVPAPLDATEALVRATHSLASAAMEMTRLLKDLRTPTVAPQTDPLMLLAQRIAAARNGEEALLKAVTSRMKGAVVEEKKPQCRWIIESMGGNSQCPNDADSGAEFCKKHAVMDASRCHALITPPAGEPYRCDLPVYDPDGYFCAEHATCCEEGCFNFRHPPLTVCSDHIKTAGDDNG